MTSLITLLIALLGYGTPADYADYTEDQLNEEIALAEAAQEDGGTGGWDAPGAHDEPTDPDDNGNGGGN